MVTSDGSLTEVRSLPRALDYEATRRLAARTARRGERYEVASLDANSLA